MEKLQSLRGIGVWTANIVAIHAFAWGRLLVLHVRESESWGLHLLLIGLKA